MKASVSFLWHLHQPWYLVDAATPALLPWTRLHAARSYYDMARVLEELPGIRVGFTFTPSLLAQLEALERGATDVYEALARRATADLGADERVFLLQRFFSVAALAMDPLPRYRQLQAKRGHDTAEPELRRRLGEFTDQELRDLTVLFHVAWTGFSARAEEPELRALLRKGQGFSEEDKALALDLTRRVAGRVLPLWRKLVAAGRIEPWAVPLCHPILPLLIDSEAARRALPDMPLPDRFAHPGDARAQIERGLAEVARCLGVAPAGMWPSEGSVSPEVVELCERVGVRHLATDEGVLLRSLDAHGAPPGRERVCRPWQVGEVRIAFRDRVLSDRIGFTYGAWEPARAVDDLLGRAHHLGGMVPIILDGENCWEGYYGAGEPFLRELYERLERDPEVRPLPPGEALHAWPHDELARLHSGSWIESNFAIWIGDPDKNRAWELLGQARADLDGVPAAQDSLLRAEGSDWFWWFGEPFHALEKPTFDELFRRHLQAAYAAAGRSAPDALLRPVEQRRKVAPTRRPRALVSPRIDGKRTSFYKWEGAGLYRPASTGALARPILASALYYGFDVGRLYLRLDVASPALREVKVYLTGARSHTLAYDARHPSLYQIYLGRDLAGESSEVAFDEVLELAVPFARLGLRAGDDLRLSVAVVDAEGEPQTLPPEGPLALTVPDEGFEDDNWTV